MKKSTKILIITVLSAVCAFVVVRAILFKDHKKPSDVKDKISVLAPDLYRLFNDSEEKAKLMYFKKDVHVKGMVKEISSNTVSGITRFTIELDVKDSSGASVSCELDPKESDKSTSVKQGDEVFLSGFCNGIIKEDPDMMMPSHVDLTNCTYLDKK